MAISQNVTFSIQPKSTTILVNVGGNILNHAFLRDDGRLYAQSGKLLKFKFFTSQCKIYTAKDF